MPLFVVSGSREEHISAQWANGSSPWKSEERLARWAGGFVGANVYPGKGTLGLGNGWAFGPKCTGSRNGLRPTEALLVKLLAR
jgi:hypothetical protein